MDKETLSNYGWIVICVLVLAVMLALATPFGTFVADAIKSTTQGLFDVNQSALNSTGLINIGDQSFENGPSITFDQELSTDRNNPSEATGTSFTLSGTATSNNGIKSLTVNGSEVAVGADGKWTTTLTLTKNEVKEISVDATDNNGTTATKNGYVGFIEWVNATVSKTAYANEIGYSDTVTDLVIPATFQKDGVWYKVTAISRDGFKNCANLKSVVIPEGITLIDISTFLGCTSLTSIEIPEGVTVVHGSSFEYCINLTSIKLPKSLSVIGGAAFFNCQSLTRIEYAGTIAEWNAVSKLSNWNKFAPATEVICSDGVTEVVSNNT